MTSWEEAYTSLKLLYKKLLFDNPHKWTLSQIDEMDVHFFEDLLANMDELKKMEQSQQQESVPKEQEVYLSDIW